MWHEFKRHFAVIVTWGLVIGILSGIVSLFLPSYYSATSQVLIISRSGGGADPYTQAKAAQQIGANLAQVMQTSDFMDKVMANAKVPFDKARWQNLSDRKARKEWQKDVRPSVVYNTSLLAVTAYSPSKTDAVNFANAVADTIVTHGTEYVGGDVVLRQVDTPLVSRIPARPNVVLNIILGFVIGTVLCALWIIKYRRHRVFH